MKRSWIFVLGVLGLATTSCSGFTVQRSNVGSFGSRNWSLPVLHLNRRNSVEKIFSDDFQSTDIENILRDSEMRQFVKLPEKKCSSSSEDPQRLKRSHDLSNSTNNSPIDEKTVAELRESTIEPSSTEIKASGSTIETLTNELKISGSPTGTSLKETRIPSSTVVTLSNETNASKTSIVSSQKEMKNPTWTIASSSEEMKSFKLPIETIRPEPKTSDIPLEKIASDKTLKNVVLLLIDYARAGGENYFKLFETARKFPVHGLLRNCHNSEFPEVLEFSSGDAIIARNVEEECECDHFLRANVRSLLSWARHKEMTTGTVSSTNFSIPLPLGYETPSIQLAKEFEDNEETNRFHQEIPRSKSESNEVWRVLDIEKQPTSGKESSALYSANPSVGILSKQEGINGFDGMWNVLDMLSKIRIAFFRILLESLGNMTGTEDEFNGKKPLPFQPSFVDMMTDAVREFKVMQNDNGFILVAAAPENEWSHAIDVLQHEILTKDSLLVVSGICSPTNERTPFFARGPGEKLFNDARAIWDLPELIQRAMTDGCLEKSCKKQRPDKTVALSSPELSSLAHEFPRKRVGRESRKLAANETTLVNTTLTKKSADEPTAEAEGKLEPGPRSGAADVRMDVVAKVLGIATSFLTMLALNSP